MMKSKSAQKIKLTSYDDLFGTNEQPSSEVVTFVPINLYMPLKTIHFRWLMMRRCRKLWKVSRSMGF